ncbi:hypothetical protein GCM10009838_66110 [Catenulispora subtropica]|uniref:Uncharacterized protein n=1 Tax=Catenulispora subtropica TaxID=450798 RepID=A0ABP5E965_9ACTN
MGFTRDEIAAIATAWPVFSEPGEQDDAVNNVPNVLAVHAATTPTGMNIPKQLPSASPRSWLPGAATTTATAPPKEPSTACDELGEAPDGTPQQGPWASP